MAIDLRFMDDGDIANALNAAANDMKTKAEFTPGSVSFLASQGQFVLGLYMRMKDLETQLARVRREAGDQAYAQSLWNSAR